MGRKENLSFINAAERIHIGKLYRNVITLCIYHLNPFIDQINHANRFICIVTRKCKGQEVLMLSEVTSFFHIGSKLYTRQTQYFINTFKMINYAFHVTRPKDICATTLLVKLSMRRR